MTTERPMLENDDTKRPLGFGSIVPGPRRASVAYIPSKPLCVEARIEADWYYEDNNSKAEEEIPEREIDLRSKIAYAHFEYVKQEEENIIIRLQKATSNNTELEKFMRHDKLKPTDDKIKKLLNEMKMNEAMTDEYDRISRHVRWNIDSGYSSDYDIHRLETMISFITGVGSELFMGMYLDETNEGNPWITWDSNRLSQDEIDNYIIKTVVLTQQSEPRGALRDVIAIKQLPGQEMYDHRDPITSLDIMVNAKALLRLIIWDCLSKDRDEVVTKSRDLAAQVHKKTEIDLGYKKNGQNKELLGVLVHRIREIYERYKQRFEQDWDGKGPMAEHIKIGDKQGEFLLREYGAISEMLRYMLRVDDKQCRICPQPINEHTLRRIVIDRATGRMYNVCCQTTSKRKCKVFDDYEKNGYITKWIGITILSTVLCMLAIAVGALIWVAIGKDWFHNNEIDKFNVIVIAIALVTIIAVYFRLRLGREVTIFELSQLQTITTDMFSTCWTLGQQKKLMVHVIEKLASGQLGRYVNNDNTCYVYNCSGKMDMPRCVDIDVLTLCNEAVFKTGGGRTIKVDTWKEISTRQEVIADILASKGQQGEVIHLERREKTEMLDEKIGFHNGHEIVAGIVETLRPKISALLKKKMAPEVVKPRRLVTGAKPNSSME